MDLVLICILVILPFLVTIFISVNLNKYGKLKTKKEVFGFEVARKILDENELENIYITESNEIIISNYDSKRKVVRLKKEIFNGDDLKSCAIASREAAKAIMHKKKNQTYLLYLSFSPLLNALLYGGYIIISCGALFGHIKTIYVGIALVYSVLLFNIFTLKVEKNANDLSLIELKQSKLLSSLEIKNISKIFDSMKYIGLASITYPIIELIKRIIKFGNSN